MAGASEAKPVTNGIIIDRNTGGIVLYRGFSLRETAGSTALVRVREGSLTGDILDTIPFGANEGVSDFYEAGIMVEGDLYCEIASGAVEGTIRYS